MIFKKIKTHISNFKNRYFSWIKAFFFVIGFICVERFCHYKTDGFQVRKILSDLTYDAKWETSFSENKEDLDQILNQPFYFLGSGGQCYAFSSHDDKYVLKVFKHHHMRKNHWLNSFPLNAKWERYRKKIAGGGEKRICEMFTSCKIAYEDLKEETGVVYLHLNKTEHLNKNLTIFDKIGIAHQINLDQLEFVIQKKAELLFPGLKKLISQDNPAESKKMIDSFLKLVAARCQKGVYDKDPLLFRNFGIHNGKVVEIDIGSFSADPFLKNKNRIKQEIFYESQELKKWLNKESSELSFYLEERLKELLTDE